MHLHWLSGVPYAHQPPQWTNPTPTAAAHWTFAEHLVVDRRARGLLSRRHPPPRHVRRHDGAGRSRPHGAPASGRNRFACHWPTTLRYHPPRALARRSRIAYSRLHGRLESTRSRLACRCQCPGIRAHFDSHCENYYQNQRLALISSVSRRQVAAATTPGQHPMPIARAPGCASKPE